jgi:tripartite-type tricarboxylate transporter receptor subunit TctC
MHLVGNHSRGGAALAIALGLALATGGASTGQPAYPERSIKIITITAAGSPADIVARLIGDKLSASLRQPVLVEAMAGAAGNLAVGYVAKAAPDGYTVVMSGDAAVTTNVTLYKDLPYDPLKNLAPITQVMATPNILAVWSDYRTFLTTVPVAGTACVIDRPSYVARGYGKRYGRCRKFEHKRHRVEHRPDLRR